MIIVILIQLASYKFEIRLVEPLNSVFDRIYTPILNEHDLVKSKGMPSGFYSHISNSYLVLKKRGKIKFFYHHKSS